MGCWVYLRVADNYALDSLSVESKAKVYQRGDIVGVYPDTTPIGTKMLDSGKHVIIQLPNIEVEVLQDFLETVEQNGILVGKRSKKIDVDNLLSLIPNRNRNELNRSGITSLDVSNDTLIRSAELVRNE